MKLDVTFRETKSVFNVALDSKNGDFKTDLGEIQVLSPTNVATPMRIVEISLIGNRWVGSNTTWSQVVSIDGVTANSMVDIQPSVEQLRIFYEKDLAFTTENDNGVVTVFAIGDKPTNDYILQATVTEVVV
jgi:hypothetical protein